MNTFGVIALPQWLNRALGTTTSPSTTHSEPTANLSNAVSNGLYATYSSIHARPLYHRVGNGALPKGKGSGAENERERTAREETSFELALPGRGVSDSKWWYS